MVDANAATLLIKNLLGYKTLNETFTESMELKTILLGDAKGSANKAFEQ
jgi:hypothetical protein